MLQDISDISYGTVGSGQAAVLQEYTDQLLLDIETLDLHIKAYRLYNRDILLLRHPHPQIIHDPVYSLIPQDQEALVEKLVRRKKPSPLFFKKFDDLIVREDKLEITS